MAVLVGNGTATPVIGSETTVATIAPGVPLDNISVYFVGGTGGGGGPLLLRLYAEVGGFQTLVAIKQAVGSNLPSIIAWDTGLGPLAGGGGGGRGGGNAEAQSNQIHAGGTNYTVTVEDLSNTPAPFSSPRLPVTITVAGVDQFDTVADAEFGATFALAPGATGTLTVFPGFAQLMDVAIDQTNILPFVTVKVTADCGGGSVIGALVASAQMSGTDSTIGEVFSELKLPVATEYFVSMTNNSQQAINITLTGVTSSVTAAGGGGPVVLVGNVNGPSNANRWTSLVTPPNTNAAPVTTIPEVGTVPGDGWWYVPVTSIGAAANRTVNLPIAPTAGEVVVITDESGFLTGANTISVTSPVDIEGAPSPFVMNAAYPSPDGSICLQFDGTAWFIFADFAGTAGSSAVVHGIEAVNRNVLAAEFVPATGEWYVGISALAGNVTVTLQDTMPSGSKVTIKDEDGSLLNFSVSVVGSTGKTLDGQATFVMNTGAPGPFGARTFQMNFNAPTEWSLVDIEPNFISNGTVGATAYASLGVFPIGPGTEAALWTLPNGVARSATNYLVRGGDGDAYINAFDGAGFVRIAFVGNTFHLFTEKGLQINDNVPDFGTGDGVLGMTVSNAVPITNPGGMVQYVDPADGSTKIRGSLGDITIIAIP